jgi:hypothetical protein
MDAIGQQNGGAAINSAVTGEVSAPLFVEENGML